ncbi:MAG: hypothetical protein A3A97_00525 [Candidatus Terrybacteria bacterium RIFCSPLOWO2_01_FULL_40_23]|uniref:Methylamine utilisation protein MauE domain-containing protein n=1 Tax=Candidatus Terrybacteria bacterium RIFCSPLOWO2_01_FULL_40_23 TaxID=1802366 RepID=A0A1G2PTL6_9BACT|nr:MAG: hypothetical protein A3A97_00525 [Candidatus Terrybacteria bacterium RIFCSPLOWO2_01_FULL_40_23]
MLDKLRERLQNYAPLFLRFGIGLVFLLFAIQKLGSPEQGRAEIQLLLNFKLGDASALNYALGVAELMVATSFFTGTFVKWTSLLGTFMVLMFFGGLVSKYGFSQDPTLNRDMGLLGGLLTLWLSGSGPISIDAWLAKKKTQQSQTTN